MPSVRFHRTDVVAASAWLGLFLLTALAWLLQPAPVRAAEPPVDQHAGQLEPSFVEQIQPFFKQHCLRCHQGEKAASGVQLEQLDGKFADRQLRLWSAVRKQLAEEVMPPEDEPQPASAERRQMVARIDEALAAARLRPTPKNGSLRRLTVAQYRNTLRELLKLDDDLSDLLPPDAVSRDGFLNNKDTLQLSPLLLEAYFQIAEELLNRSIVDPQQKPAIRNFRVDLGASINKAPCPDDLILGANNLLLENKDLLVTEPALAKPFPFERLALRKNYRFIEGYAGNATVRGWREYDSIYHAVFACMRGSPGYPEGEAYSTVPAGLLLRPAIPADDFTYGPKANFKISVRELPDDGNFRVTVTAAKYKDGLLLEQGAAPQAADSRQAVVSRNPQAAGSSVNIEQPGIYQVDVYSADWQQPAADASKLADGLIGVWPAQEDEEPDTERAKLAAQFVGNTQLVGSPFGQALRLNGESAIVRRHEALNVGEGDFTITAWVHPRQLQPGGLVSLGKHNGTHGWFLDLPDNQGTLRIATFGPDGRSNGSVTSRRDELHTDRWQYVAAVVRRGPGQSYLCVNGYVVAAGSIDPANLDNPRVDLHLGRVQGSAPFRGDMADVRLYRRALDEAEIRALVEPGRQFVRPPKPHDVTLTLGQRHFSGALRQPAFLAVRLPAGELPVSAGYTGARPIARVVLSRLPENHQLARDFARFEQRSPWLGVHLGLRRDCGSTLSPVGPPQCVSSTEPNRFVFTGAIRNFPSPEVEKDNVNYLAGIREIGVRSEYTDGRDMPRLLIRSVEFEGPFYNSWPPESYRNIFVDFDRPGDPPAYARAIIRRFAGRAFRRAITTAEESALMAVFTRASGEGAAFQESIQRTLQLVLTSPQFLFLIENSNSPTAEPLDDDELASKLSYFLWNGPPDARLLELAASGRLRGELDGEVNRLLEDPRSWQFVREFAAQWLGLDKFDVVESDRHQFPKLTHDARQQLRQEPARLLEYLIRHNLPMRSLVQADFLIANDVTAGYYDLADRTESGFAFVPITHGRGELGGVLTQAAILAGLSDGRESNPVKRGAWLARKIVAEPPDDPPPNVPALEPPKEQLTLRQRLERHRNQTGCAQCHAKIDPWGLALEEFNAGGRLKKEPVDARSTLPDKTEVAGAGELKRYLAEERIDQVAFSMAKHLTTYGTGRTLSYSELESLKQQTLKLKPTGYRMQDLIRFVVHSDLFLEK